MQAAGVYPLSAGDAKALARPGQPRWPCVPAPTTIVTAKHMKCDGHSEQMHIYHPSKHSFWEKTSVFFLPFPV
jgi:hypothetical protein